MKHWDEPRRGSNDEEAREASLMKLLRAHIRDGGRGLQGTGHPKCYRALPSAPEEDAGEYACHVPSSMYSINSTRVLQQVMGKWNSKVKFIGAKKN